MSANSSNAFRTTRWTRVLASKGDSDEARIALSELCSAYYGPVVAFLTHTGCGDEEPREVAHEFFARLLVRDGLAGAEPSRGRFRSYLLGAVKHHVANRRLHASRKMRGGEADHQAIQSGTDTTLELPIASLETPGLNIAFDREWALAVVERALGVLEHETARRENTRYFSELKPWLSFDESPGSQAQVAARLGINEGAVKVAVHRLRRRFREIVRAEVAQTLPEGDDLDAEMRYLIEALARG